MKIPIKQYHDLLINYLKPLWFKVLLLTILFITGIGLQLVNPQIMRYFIDTAKSGGALQKLTFAAVLFISISLIASVVSAFASYVSNDLGWRATNRLRSDLVLHILQLDMSFHSTHTPGELIERIDGDVTRLANFLSQFVIRLLGGILLSLGILILLIYEDIRIGLALTAFVSIYLLVHIRSQQIAVPHWRAERGASADLFGFLEERLSALKDIRSLGAIAYVMRRFHEVVRRAFWTNFKANVITDVGWTISNFVFAAGYVVIMALGAHLFLRDVITIGTVYLILHYLQMLRSPLNTIRNEIEDLQRVRVSIERVKELTDTQSTIRDGIGEALPLGALSVAFRNVSFAYHAGVPVLHDVSFQLNPGGVLGLLGRTGSGKTTLSRLLCRFYDPSSGEVSLSDVDIRLARLSDLRQRVGLVTQEVQLFQGSLRDNLTLFEETINDEKILTALRTLGLEAWYRALPNGLDTEIGSSGSGLSAGEGQLLALTRVFLKDPGLVILDEASSRLDPATEALLEQAIAQLLKDRTAVIIAHRLSTVQRANEILILEEGHIKEHGEYDRLVSDPNSIFSGLLRTGLEEVLA
jgi:ABC-type multidrug transport system fused ATPase/permease subunit